jgi:hypothetical protein
MTAAGGVCRFAQMTDKAAHALFTSVTGRYTMSVCDLAGKERSARPPFFPENRLFR